MPEPREVQVPKGRAMPKRAAFQRTRWTKDEENLVLLLFASGFSLPQIKSAVGHSASAIMGLIGRTCDGLDTQKAWDELDKRGVNQPEMQRLIGLVRIRGRSSKKGGA